MFELSEIIDLAIQIEGNGEKTYSEAARRAARPDIVRALEQLASDEREHVAWFEKLKTRTGGPQADETLRDFGRQLLGEILGAQAFSLADADFMEIETVQDVLKVALEFEKDTILFYQMIRAAVTEPQASQGLDKIINEENQHVKLLEGFLSNPLKALDR